MTHSTATTDWPDHSHLVFTPMARCVWSSVWLGSRRAPGDVPPAGVAPGSERLDFGAEPNVLLVDPSESDSLLVQRLVRFAYRRLRELGLPPQRFDGGLEFTHTVRCKCRVVAGVECLVDGGRFLPASLPGSGREGLCGCATLYCYGASSRAGQ